MKKTIFQNDQWIVTVRALSTKRPAPPYEIPLSRILEINDERVGDFYEWPIHMAETKDPWLSIVDFLQAFRAAIDYKYGLDSGKVSLERLERSQSEAVDIYRSER